MRALFALTFGAVVCLTCIRATDARATTVPPQVILLNEGPFPANGALHFSDGAVSVTVTSGTQTFAGAIEGDVWRPTAPLTPGLLYEYAVNPGSGSGSRGTFTVTDAYAPSSHELVLDPVLVVALEPGGEEVCCEPEPATRSLGRGCYHSELVEYAGLRWNVASPLPDNLAGQYTYRLVDYSGFTIRDAPFTGEQPFASLLGPSYAIRVPPDLDEYCVVFEVKSLITREVFTTRRCVANTLSWRGSRPRVEIPEMRVADCPLPPLGFRDQWCEALWGECQLHFGATSGEARERQIERCSGYRSTCLPTGAAPASSMVSSARDTGCSVAARPSGCAWVAGVVAVAFLVRRRNTKLVAAARSRRARTARR